VLNNVRKGQNSMIENKKAREQVKVFCSKCNDYLITDCTNSLHYCLLCNIWSKGTLENAKGLDVECQKQKQ
jgi:ribosomal protein S26